MPADDRSPSQSGSESPDSLREQAAACRRLAAAARTRAGNSSLNALADHFDDQAARLDPMSMFR